MGGIPLMFSHVIICLGGLSESDTFYELLYLCFQLTTVLFHSPCDWSLDECALTCERESRQTVRGLKTTAPIGHALLLAASMQTEQIMSMWVLADCKIGISYHKLRLQLNNKWWNMQCNSHCCCHLKGTALGLCNLAQSNNQMARRWDVSSSCDALQAAHIMIVQRIQKDEGSWSHAAYIFPFHIRITVFSR